MIRRIARGNWAGFVVGVCVVQAVALSDRAQAGVWSNLGLFTNHAGTALAGDPTDPLVLYCGTSADGVYKTSDGGTSWSPANTGLTTPFILSLLGDPTTPATVYVGTNGGGVFKSTDGAMNWSAANTGLSDLNGLALVMDPTDPLTIYVATFAGVFKSVDGAASWSAASSGLTNLNVQGLAIDPVSPAILYAATYGDGIFITTDGAATWTASNSGLSFLFATDVAVDPNNPSNVFVGVGTSPTLYKSVDGGATWSSSSFGLPSVAFSIALDATIPGRVWVGTGSALYRSGNGGATWAWGGAGMADPSNTAQAMLVLPGSPTRTYAAVSACCGDGPVYQLDPFCGDGALDGGEQCDDANFDDGDGCDSSCQVEECNSCDDSEPSLCAPDDGQSCDDGDACTQGDTCSAGACTTTPVLCPACEGCTAGVCLPAPRNSCAQSTEPGKSKLSIKDKSDDGKDALLWKWTKGDELLAENLGDPTTDTEYSICIYDAGGAVAFRATAPAGGTCDTIPCWKQLGSGGFNYKDKAADPDGVFKLQVKPGDAGKAKAKVKGKGDLLALPDLSGLNLPLLVQLQADEPATCIEETFSSGGVKSSSASKFIAVSD